MVKRSLSNNNERKNNVHSTLQASSYIQVPSAFLFFLSVFFLHELLRAHQQRHCASWTRKPPVARREKKKKQASAPGDGDRERGSVSGEEVEYNAASDAASDASTDDDDERSQGTNHLSHENVRGGRHRRDPHGTREESGNETCRPTTPGVPGVQGGTTRGDRGRAGAPDVLDGGGGGGAGDGAAPAYPERLHRGHSAKIKVWEKR